MNSSRRDGTRKDPKPQNGSPQENAPNNFADTSKCSTVKEWFASSGFWTALATIVIAFFTITLAVTADRQWEVIRDELLYAHPPRLKVNIVEVSISRDRNVRDVPLPIKAGDRLDGTIHVINVGDSSAKIIHSYWMPWWQHPLPMFRPWSKEGVDANVSRKLSSKRGTSVIETMEPGDYGKFTIDNLVVPASYDSTLGFYVTGVLVYKYTDLGDRSPVRHVMFARRYDPAKGYFVPEPNRPEYEGEE